MRIMISMIVLCTMAGLVSAGEFEQDTIATEKGDLIITFIGHGTLMFGYNGQIIHIDPVERYADYKLLPKADIILVTHHHGDHLDPAAIALLRKPGTVVIESEMCARQGVDGIVMKNGDERVVSGIRIKAVPAYNIVHKRENGEPFHPKGTGNGYVLYLPGFSVYIAGDTENIPEMKEIEGVDCAFLPMNLPYTMTPAMVADAVEMLKPGILYPYHFGETDTGELARLLSNKKSPELRIRNMK